MNLFKKIISLFKNIHVQSLMGNGVMAAFGMLTFAILYRVMPNEKEMGIYLFFGTLLSFTDTLRSGLLTNAFIKFYSGTEKNRGSEVAGSAWLIGLLITALSAFISIVGYAIVRHIGDAGMVLFFKYFALVSIVTLPSFMANIAVQGNKRFDRLLWMRLINQVLFVGAVIVLYVSKKANADTVVIVYIISNAITSIIILLLRWTMVRSVRSATRNAFWELFNFGKFSVGTGMSTNLFGLVNTFIINSYIGPAGLAIYNLGNKLIQVIEMPLLSFAASGMPTLSAYYNNGQKQEMIYVAKKIIGMLTTSFLPLVIISFLFAEPIIGLLGGKGYIHTEAPNLFRIAMGMTLLFPADRFFALTLDVIHKPKINFYKVLIMLVANIAACYVGVLIWPSIYSVALAGVVPLLIAVLIGYYSLRKYIPFSFGSIYIVGVKETGLFLNSILKNLHLKK